MPRKGGGVKFLKEYTPFKTAPLKDKYRSSQGKARHYGLNVALGGTGNINPFSGNRIIANGNHGHFYVFFKRPHSDRSKFAGLLLGCEGSCPIDRKQANTVTRRSNLKDNVLGLALAQSCNFPVDQTGGLHTFGHSGKFSPTGGMKWKDTSWHDAGPRKSNDAMFIDFSTPAAMKRVYDNADTFDPMWLGSTWHGGKAPPQRPSRANRWKIKQIGPLNAEELYGRIILQRTRGDWNTVGGHVRTQVERDVALWYGAIVKPSTRREN